MLSLGIDIGGSGIKGAIVNTLTGEMVTDRLRISTPQPAEKSAVLNTLQALIKEFSWKDGPIGIGFPGVIRSGIVQTAANLHKSLIGTDFSSELQALYPGKIVVLNDADAAGYAEMRLGVGSDIGEKTALLLTVGTGIGTVMFCGDRLVPNLELGHVEYNGRNAESYVAERARKAEELSWKRWGKRFNGYLQYLEFLLQPDLIILGGGGVKKPEKFADQLTVKTPILYAKFGNRAGIIGAAIRARELAQIQLESLK